MATPCYHKEQQGPTGDGNALADKALWQWLTDCALPVTKFMDNLLAYCLICITKDPSGSDNRKSDLHHHSGELQPHCQTYANSQTPDPFKRSLGPLEEGPFHITIITYYKSSSQPSVRDLWQHWRD